MTTCTIDGCGRPVEDAYVCQGCTLTVERALGDVRWLDDQLGMLLKTADGVGWTTGTPERGLPYDQAAAEARWVLTNTVNTWARVILEEVPRSDLPGVSEAPTGPSCRTCMHRSCRRIRATEPPSLGVVAIWLASYANTLRNIARGEAMGDLLAAVRSARRIVDTRPERMYAGPCDECRQDLYARPGAARITCSGCQTTYDAADRREALLEAARDHLGTVREVVALFGGSVTRDQVKGWIKRGKIGAHGSTVLRGKVVATYRVGDVEDAAKAERFDEREQRATRRAGRSA